MRLATKINIFSALIFTLLMTMVAIATQNYLARVFRDQMQRSLAISEQGFNRAIQSLCEDQSTKAKVQSQRDVLRFSAREHFGSVLYYYLHLSQTDLNVDRLEVIDERGGLLADGARYYEGERIVFPSPLRHLGDGDSYIARRDADLFLISAVPLDYLGQRVGYVGAGQRLDRDYLASLASMIHGELVILLDGDYAVGTLNTFQAPARRQIAGLRPGRHVFVPGVSADGTTYNFVFTAVKTAGLKNVLVGIGLDNRSVAMAMARARVFLLFVSLVGLGFAWIGSYLLARNIKRSIHGMEPGEIAAVLNERNAILESTSEGIIAVDRTGGITLVNREAQKLLPRGMQPLGHKIAELLADPDIPRVLATGQAVYNQQRVLGETVVFYNTVPIKVYNETVGAVITLRDLTEFQKVAAELVELKSYTQALRAQSHEFLNILHTVSGLIQLGRCDQALQQLHQTTQIHQELVSFLLRAIPFSNISGILLGKFNRAAELNIRFNLSRASRLNAVNLPETELVCVIGNLIENSLESLKASEAPDKQVWVKIRERRQYLSILVMDNGPGIPPSIRGQIFERGFTTKVGQNKGMGLALVNRCVQNLRGAIGFRSDRLTAFWVRIPTSNRDSESALAAGQVLLRSGSKESGVDAVDQGAARRG